MRRHVWGIIVAMALFLAGCSVHIGGSGHSNPPNDPFAPPANAVATHLGEIGPGACWPKDERPSGIKDPAAGFATEDGPSLAANWFRAHKDEQERLLKEGVALRYDKWFDSHKEYYLVYEVVLEWDKLSSFDRMITYIGKMKAIQLSKPMHVQNTSCTGSEVVIWKVQTLPAKEWIFFVPGHEPGSEKGVRPVLKAVCGNPLLPPPAPTTQPSSSASSTPPAGGPTCETSCTSTPPTKKDPAKDPNAQGNAPAGGDKNGDPGPGETKSYNPPPPAYTPPPAPAATQPPVGSTPTSHVAPPPGSVVNPTDGGDNTGDPGSGGM